MPRRSSQKKLEQLTCEIDRLKAKAKEEARRLDARKKIILGAMLEKMMSRSAQEHQRIMRELDAYVTRGNDRHVVGLPRTKGSLPPPPAPPVTDDDITDLDDFIQ
jgi:hypothetical protein